MGNLNQGEHNHSILQARNRFRARFSTTIGLSGVSGAAACYHSPGDELEVRSQDDEDLEE